MDPDSPAYIVYHDHSYFIRHETSNSSIDNTQKRKSSIQSQVEVKSSLPTVQVLNRLLLEHQQKTKNSQTDSTTSTTTPIDFTAILRALLVKQGHHLPSTITNDTTPSSPSSTAAS